MQKEVITTKQAIAIMTMFMIAGALTHVISSEAGRDFWVSYLIVTVFTLFIFFVYSRILTLFPQKNLLDIQKLLFGKIAGTLIYASYVYYAFMLGCVIPRHFTEFLQSSLPETPQYAYAIIMVVVCIYIVKTGIETLGRWCLFSLPIVVFVFMLTIIFSVNIIHPQNLKPILQSSITSIADSTFSAFTLPLGEGVLFLLLFDSLKDSTKSKKVYYVSLAICVSMIMLAQFRNIMVLGAENSALLANTSVGAVSIIQISSFVERIEVIITIIFILCGLVKTTVLLMGASKGAAKLLKLDSDQHLVAPLGLLMLAFSFNFFENFMHLNSWFKVYRVLFLPLQTVIPIVTWIVAEIKVKRQKNGTAKKVE